MEEIKKRLDKILENEEIAHLAGGTYSSWTLRKCLQLKEEIESYQHHSEYDALHQEICRTITLWQQTLQRHNSQELKVTGYDLDTGLPFESGVLMEPMVIKPKQK